MYVLHHYLLLPGLASEKRIIALHVNELPYLDLVISLSHTFFLLHHRHYTIARNFAYPIFLSFCDFRKFARRCKILPRRDVKREEREKAFQAQKCISLIYFLLMTSRAFFSKK